MNFNFIVLLLLLYFISITCQVTTDPNDVNYIKTQVNHLNNIIIPQNITFRIHPNETEISIVPNIVHFIRLEYGAIPYYLYIHILTVFNNFGDDVELYFHSEKEPTGDLWNSLNNYCNIKWMTLDSNVGIFGMYPAARIHKSDILRLDRLKKYGGIYLDLDVIILRNFKKLRNSPMTMGKQNYKGIYLFFYINYIIIILL